MNERACMTSAGDVDAGMDAGGYPVETTGNVPSRVMTTTVPWR